MFNKIDQELYESINFKIDLNTNYQLSYNVKK